MCNAENTREGVSELRRQANWKGSGEEGRKELLDKLS